MKHLLLVLLLTFSTGVFAEKYFLIAKAPHPFDLGSVPANVQVLFTEVGLQAVQHNRDGTWRTMAGTRINQGKRLLMFMADVEESALQTLLNDNNLANFEIVAYRTEFPHPDIDSTTDDPLPSKPKYSRIPGKAALIGWMADEWVGEPPNQIAQRPTELRLMIIAGTGQWETVE